ncbi:holin [Nocardioides sp. WS12]|uniref:holin n=1 Tax=Nocardioides sp. WS12 TaxID=2486272 RepID=UPI0015F8BA72|nr:holin [Nocardioides sp. WS12]
MKINDRTRDLIDRAAVTAAQGAILAIGGETVTANALTFDWSTIGGYALGGAVLSVLINVARGGLSGRINLEHLDGE